MGAAEAEPPQAPNSPQCPRSLGSRLDPRLPLDSGQQARAAWRVATSGFRGRPRPSELSLTCPLGGGTAGGRGARAAAFTAPGRAWKQWRVSGHQCSRGSPKCPFPPHALLRWPQGSVQRRRPRKPQQVLSPRPTASPSPREPAQVPVPASSRPTIRAPQEGLGPSGCCDRTCRKPVARAQREGAAHRPGSGGPRPSCPQTRALGSLAVGPRSLLLWPPRVVGGRQLWSLP